MKWSAMLLVLLYRLVTVAFSDSTDHPHRVRNLPGAPPEPVFPLYSGYIDLEIHRLQHKVFYVLCEAIRSDPLEAPLVVWLNGGPGASSLLGLLLEHGPYILETDGSLRYNDFSWNQYANLLYIESPVFVGFSHVSNDSRYTNAKAFARGANALTSENNNYQDDATATLNTDALHVFMTTVHPRYANRDFFIAGESYGGLYVPFFAREVLAGIKNGTFTNDRFKGISMGNAGMDIYTRMLSGVMQSFSMGMVPQKISERLLELWQITRDGNPGDWFVNEIWTWMGDFRYLLKSTNGTGATYLYNLHLDCEDSDINEVWHIEKKTKHAECSVKEVPERYLNREDVQKALHVISVGNSPLKWIAINHDVTLSYYQAFEIFDVYGGIVNAAKDDFRVLYFSGDLDLACPAIHVSRGTTIIATKYDFEVVKDSPNVWQYLGDFGGTQASYRRKNSSITMDVLTVRGAGHLVPINHPSRAFQIINNFIFANEAQIDYSKKIRRRKFIDGTKQSTEDPISKLLANI